LIKNVRLETSGASLPFWGFVCHVDTDRIGFAFESFESKLGEIDGLGWAGSPDGR
jgi:hypothetical protein